MPVGLSAITISVLAFGCVSPTPLQAQERTVTTTVYGDDACPKPSGDEIVVCARQPESERYRIPKRFREKREDPASQSWASRVEMLEEVNRVTMPNSCSPVGTNGQTGCTAQMLRQWMAERRAAAAEEADIP